MNEKDRWYVDQNNINLYDRDLFSRRYKEIWDVADESTRKYLTTLAVCVDKNTSGGTRITAREAIIALVRRIVELEKGE